MGRPTPVLAHQLASAYGDFPILPAMTIKFLAELASPRLQRGMSLSRHVGPNKGASQSAGGGLPVRSLTGDSALRRYQNRAICLGRSPKFPEISA